MSLPSVFHSTKFKVFCCLAGGIFAASSLQADDPVAEEAVEEQDKETPTSFLVLEDINVPIVDSGRLDGVLHVTYVIKAKSPEAVDNLTQRVPEIRSAALANTIEFARLYASPYTAVDVGQLSQMVSAPIKKLDKQIYQVLVVKVSANTA